MSRAEMSRLGRFGARLRLCHQLPPFAVARKRTGLGAALMPCLPSARLLRSRVSYLVLAGVFSAQREGSVAGFFLLLFLPGLRSFPCSLSSRFA